MSVMASPTLSLADMSEEKLALMLSTASKAADATLRKFARDHDLPEAWDVVVSFRVAHDDDFFHIQRKGCDNAIIYVNAMPYLALVSTSDKQSKARFKLAALRAIKLATTLSKSGSALITGDLAYAITSARKRIRRTIIESSFNALDDRYFSVSGILTVTDRLGGKSISAEIVPVISLDNQVHALKRSLSREMLQDAETEEVVDLLELARNKMIPVVSPESYSISLRNNEMHTTVSYHHNILAHNTTDTDSE